MTQFTELLYPNYLSEISLPINSIFIKGIAWEKFIINTLKNI